MVAPSYERLWKMIRAAAMAGHKVRREQLLLGSLAGGSTLSNVQRTPVATEDTRELLRALQTRARVDDGGGAARLGRRSGGRNLPAAQDEGLGGSALITEGVERDQNAQPSTPLRLPAWHGRAKDQGLSVADAQNAETARPTAG
jgi:hypothetical protein